MHYSSTYSYAEYDAKQGWQWVKWVVNIDPMGHIGQEPLTNDSFKFLELRVLQLSRRFHAHIQLRFYTQWITWSIGLTQCHL